MPLVRRRLVPRGAGPRPTPRTLPSWIFLLACTVPVLAAAVAAAGDGNRLAYLDNDWDPYYVGLDFPRLTTPQWVGEEGVDAVVVLAIDDMRDTDKYEQYLRPILERLKQIDGRAPVSIMTCSVAPDDPQLQTWLREGLSIECHTFDHPCPLLQGGDFEKARSTYERCIDLLSRIPGSRPVAFRMPCCDSRNTPSPRFYQEIFNGRTENGNYLQIDSSVFNITTSRDPALPAKVAQDADGSERFRKYLPFPSFVNTIEDYPYPYVVSGLCWEFPCIVPSDWEAQNLQQPNNPRTVADMQAALDAVVIKQGVFDLVFHPHGWIRNDQVVEWIDYAVRKYGGRVKFLTFGEALDRINEHLLAGHPLRAEDGTGNGVHLLDVNHDGFQDVVIQNARSRRLRVWNPETGRWADTNLPRADVMQPVRFAVMDPQGTVGVVADGALVPLLALSPQTKARRLPPELREAARPAADMGMRFRDLDGDGRCELIVGGPLASGIYSWRGEQNAWQKLPYALPAGTRVVDAQGRDAGLRWIDVNQDGFDDVLFSNGDRYALHLFSSPQQGWDTPVLQGNRGDADAPRPVIPMFVRPDGTDNGAWFHSGKLWVQNEDTHRLPDNVDRLALADMLPAADPDMPPPRGADASLREMRTVDGARVELVAAEPLVQDPVAFDWGADGRLWVVEMRDYPNGLDWQKAGDAKNTPGGRVKRLTDTDGDGRYDESTVFLDQLAFPTGVKAWRDGILVTAAPHVFFAADRDGDGVADERTVLYEGFGEGNQQHRVNGLRWSLDGWLVLANGDSGGTVRSVRRDETVSINGRDLRIHPDSGRLEVLSGQTQFGRTRDDFGNWFGGNNSNPLWHYVLDERYLRRNPHFAPPSVRRSVPDQPGAAPVYPVSRTLTRFNDFDRANRFTSACSPMVYRDHVAELDGALESYVFVCEPVHNLVNRQVMRPSGFTFASHRLASERSSEFLASRDSWFRPSMVRTGPDGAVWVADMYRLVIEHPQWIPAEWQRKLDLRSGSDRGRIYRVWLPGASRVPFPGGLDRRETGALVDLLRAPNGTLRDMAHQQLVWRNDRRCVPRLIELLDDRDAPRAALHALYLLEAFEQLDDATLERAVRQAPAAVARHAVRLAERRLPGSESLGRAMLSIVRPAADAPHERHLQLQLAYSLGAWPDPRATRALAELALAHRDDAYMTAAVLSSVHEDNVGDLLHMVLARREGHAPALVTQLLRFAMAADKRDAVDRAVAEITRSSPGTPRRWQLEILGSALEDWRRSKATLTTMLRPATRAAWSKWTDEARRLSADPRASMELRSAAIRILGKHPSERAADRRQLLALLVPQVSVALQLQVIDALAELNDEPFPAEALAGWSGYSPAVRARLLDVLLSRTAWTRQLLDGLESGAVPAASLDPRRRQQLAQHRDQQIRRRAETLLEASTANRADLVQAYADRLETPGDADRGRLLFEKHCGKCHRLNQKGYSLGPDLAALTDKSAGTLLTAILDPNRAVEDKFLNYVVLAVDGQQHTGMIIRESSNALTLSPGENKDVTILRGDIDQLASTGKSVMPEGFEKELDPPAMADVIAYLRQSRAAPKQFPGNTPQVAPVRDDGSIRLFAMHSRIYGPTLVFEPKYRNLGYWQSIEDHAVWDVDVPKAGRYRVILDYASDPSAAGDRYVLTIAGQQLGGVVASTGSWDRYRSQPIGTVQLPAGRTELRFHSDGHIRAALIDLRTIRLAPES